MSKKNQPDTECCIPPIVVVAKCSHHENDCTHFARTFQPNTPMKEILLWYEKLESNYFVDHMIICRSID